MVSSVSPINPLHNRPEETVPVAALLIFAAGTLDAYTYVGHGAVFANAMTGNVVLLTIRLATGAWAGVMAYLTPILAYLGGVVVAHTIKEPPFARTVTDPARASLVLEIAFLIVVALLPGRLPDMVVVAGIAFVAAVQGTSFTKIEGFAYTSVTTTGNLRHFAESFLNAAIFIRDEPSRREAFFFFTVVACFFLGALSGAFATTHWPHQAAWLPVLLLSAALILCLPWNRPLHRLFQLPQN